MGAVLKGLNLDFMEFGVVWRGHCDNVEKDGCLVRGVNEVGCYMVESAKFRYCELIPNELKLNTSALL